MSLGDLEELVALAGRAPPAIDGNVEEEEQNDDEEEHVGRQGPEQGQLAGEVVDVDLQELQDIVAVCAERQVGPRFARRSKELLLHARQAKADKNGSDRWISL